VWWVVCVGRSLQLSSLGLTACVEKALRGFESRPLVVQKASFAVAKVFFVVTRASFVVEFAGIVVQRGPFVVERAALCPSTASLRIVEAPLV
jgi:hypothetical protein